MTTPSPTQRNRSSTIRPLIRPPLIIETQDVEKRQLMRAEEGQLHLNGIMGPASEKDELHEDIESTRRQLAEEDLLSPRRKKHLLNDSGSDWKLLLEDTTDVGKRYAKLCRKTAQEIRLGIPTEYSFATIKPTLKAILHPRRRLPLSLFLLLFIFFLYYCQRHSSPISAAPYLQLLTADGYNASRLDRSTGDDRSANKAKVLESFSNPYGFINLVDPYAGGVFNPSILVLPDSVGLGYRHLLVARGAEKLEFINKEETRWESVVGCFMLPMIRPHLELPYLARESNLEVLKLPAQRKMDFVRCANPMFDQFVGPEDPRLFFTNDGQPLLIYSQSGRNPHICRAINIIDARVVIPDLARVLKTGGWDPPIVFKEQTDLIRDDQFDIEKNWSPFLGENDDLFFHVSLVPQLIYKYVPGLALRALVAEPPTDNCLTQVIGADMRKVHFHHATPLLRATLCRRGECVPDVHNTVLMGMIHIKYHPEPYLFYERRIVTWNTTAPYEYLSVSKPLTYSGTNQADPIFTTAIAWDHPSKSHHGLGLNHGFLDDIVLISFGVRDYGSAYVDVLARDMLSEHTVCQGAQGSSLWR